MLERSYSPGLVSIIIVNFNGSRFLPALSQSLAAQDYENIEVIFVDNASTDDSADVVAAQLPDAVFVPNTVNSGFAGGNNLGLSHATGEFIMLINNDTSFGSSLVSDMVRAYRSIPNCGVLQPKIRLMQQTDLLDSCGSFWTASGFLYHYGNKKAHNRAEYCEAFKVFSVKGVCLLTTRQIIDHVGLFDDDYWCYFEETDFCNRVLLSGKDCWYSPSTEIYHDNGGTSSLQSQTLVQYHSFKNRLNSYLKNLELLTLLRILPVYFLINVAWAAKLTATGKFRIALVPFQAVLWNLANLRNTLAKRKHIQQVLRRVADRDMFPDVTLNPPLSYYLTFERGGRSFSDIQRKKP